MAWLDRLSGGLSHNLSRPGRRAGSIFIRHLAGAQRNLAASRRFPVGVAAVLAVTAGGIVALAVGCGNQYRPVITPINPTGPAALPSAQITVISQPGFAPLAAGVTGPCGVGTFSTPSIFTLLDFSGDSVIAQANGGNGPITFSLESGGANVYVPNCDGTLTTAQSTTASLQTKYVLNSTLLPGSVPTNTLLANGSLYVTEAGLHGPTCLATNCVAQMTGSPDALKQEIPVAPSLINLAGFSTGERIYAISQGNSGGGAQPAWGDCATPGAVGVAGEADAIETTTNTISARLPLGICPVYGFMTQDTLRAFIMNRGSGTVTVINSQLNAIDSAHPTITVGAGPVYADYYRLGQKLVTANYDSNTISIIDASLDQYGNDSATFGTVLATVPVGLHPVELSVLEDGSRVYVANQGDIAAGTPGSISIVNLSNYTVEKTIALNSNPHAIGAIYNYPIGKVYVASQNSPYLTIIRTDTDIVSDTVEMEGNIVDMHVNAQYPGQATAGALNYQTESRSVGSGAP
jgi:DNA-binding beta-propeller fold protein YncE